MAQNILRFFIFVKGDRKILHPENFRDFYLPSNIIRMITSSKIKRVRPHVFPDLVLDNYCNKAWSSSSKTLVYYMCATLKYEHTILRSNVSTCYLRCPGLCDHSSPGVRSSTRNENRTRDREGCSWH